MRLPLHRRDIDINLVKCASKYYNKIEDMRLKQWHPKRVPKCPQCRHSRDYSYTSLLKHARRIAMKSKSVVFKDKAKHLALVKYLENDLAFTTNLFDSITMNTKVVANEKQYKWPWIVVVANIPIELKNGRYVRDTVYTLKDEWIELGFNPVKVSPLLHSLGHSGLAVVEFGRSWIGYDNALRFVRNKHGRKDWYDKAWCKDGKLYAWIASHEDHSAPGIVGDYLKNHNLKTLSEIQKEIEANSSKNRRSVEEQTEITYEKFNSDKRMMVEKTNQQRTEMTRKHEDTNQGLEKLRKASETLNGIERKKVELAVQEHKVAGEKILRLAEHHKDEGAFSISQALKANEDSA